MDPARQAQLDKLLTWGAKALELTPTQYEDAVQKYQAVGTWLNEPASLLADAEPQVFPQGSMAIGTATKPVGRDEFDLDLVCQLQVGDGLSPAQLKAVVGRRLHENSRYRDRLEEKNRCWRIVYAGEFHMDILPGRPDARLISKTGLLIPDKELATWKETDPKGYAAWFFDRSRQTAAVAAGVRAEVEAPPPDPNATTKTTLQLAVQILKRHRDLCFRDDDDAPISIIITTLAARAYAGEVSVFGSLQRLLRHMPTFIETNAAGAPVVSNPVNPLENFADKWGEIPRKKECFFTWIRAARHDLSSLEDASLANSVKALTPLVGERAGREAVRQYGSMIDDRRTTGLFATPTTGAISGTHTRARPIPRQTFYGKDF